jgi:hypothetical protein
VAGVVFLATGHAIAQEAAPKAPLPKTLWTKVDARGAQREIEVAACELRGQTEIDGHPGPLALEVHEDDVVICRGAESDTSAVRIEVLFSREPSRSSEVIVRVEVPDGSSEVTVDDLRAALRTVAAEIERRALASSPRQVVRVPQTSDTPEKGRVPKPTSRPTQMYSPTLHAFGILGVVLGTVAMSLSPFTGVGTLLVGALGSAICGVAKDPCKPDVSGGVALTVTLLAGGASLLTFGAVAIVIGGRQVARVSPHVGPTGAGLRITF